MIETILEEIRNTLFNSVPSVANPMKKVKIENLVEGLKELPDEDFTCQGVYQFLSDNPVDVDTVSHTLFWSDKFYTRNLIYKDERFELMSLCWEKGQVSRVHNHADQMCWMMVVDGTLHGQNYAVDEIDEQTGHCKLRKTVAFDLSDCLSAAVELEEPIHQILNLPEFDERAVSLHIYSKPFESCLSYCTDTDTYKEVPLFYTSINGELCKDIVL